MKYRVLVSRTFQQKFNQIQKNFQNKIKLSLDEIQKDPYQTRPNCDVKSLKDTKPTKYRLRVGNYRIIFIVTNNEIKVIDLLKRETGYSRPD